MTETKRSALVEMWAREMESNVRTLAGMAEWEAAIIRDVAAQKQAMAKREDSLVEGIAAKHTEYRLALEWRDQFGKLQTETAPGTIFGIDRATGQARLQAACGVCHGTRIHDPLEKCPIYSEPKAQLDQACDSIRDFTAKIKKRNGFTAPRAPADPSFLRDDGYDDGYEEERAPFYAQLHCEQPGYNMKLTLDDPKPAEPKKLGAYDHSCDAYSYDLGTLGRVSFAGKVVHMLRSLKESRSAPVLEAFEIMAKEVRRLAPRPVARWAKPGTLFVDRMGFERMTPEHNDLRPYIMMAAPMRLRARFDASANLAYRQSAHAIRFELHNEVQRMYEGSMQWFIEYREEDSPNDPPGSPKLEMLTLSRALFDSDPAIIKLVRQVGDAHPIGRGGDFEANRANAIAERSRLEPFFMKAWNKGAMDHGVNLKDPTPLGWLRRNKLSVEGRAFGEACARAEVVLRAIGK